MWEKLVPLLLINCDRTNVIDRLNKHYYNDISKPIK